MISIFPVALQAEFDLPEYSLFFEDQLDEDAATTKFAFHIVDE